MSQKQKNQQKTAENTEQFPGNICRTADVVVRQEGETSQLELSASTETPVLELVWWNDEIQRAYRILEHSDAAIDRTYMQDGLVVTDGHFGDQIGMLRNVQIKDKKLQGGPVDWSSTERAQAIMKDAEAGIRKNVSVDGTVDEDSYELEGEQDGYPVLRAKRWQPHRVAFVSVGGDPKVGVGRELEQQPTVKRNNNMGNENQENKQTEATERKVKELEEQIEQDKKDLAEGKSQAARSRDEEVVNMLTLAKYQNVKREIFEDAVASNKTMREFREIVKEEVNKGNTENPVQREAEDKVPEEEQRKFSITRAIRSLAGDKVDAGFEREMSDEIAKSTGREAQGIYVPVGALSRDLSVGGSSGGANAVASNLRAGDMVELLRNRLVLNELGVEILSGLEGDQQIPKHTGASTGYWLSEGESTTESDQTLGQLNLTPHTLGATTDVTRKFVRQSSMDAERFVINDILRTIAIESDRAGLHGTGNDGQPLGLITHLIAESVNAQSIDTNDEPTYAEYVAFESDIESANAAIGSLKWGMDPKAKARARVTDLDSGSGIKVMQPGTNEILGYPVVSSNQFQTGEAVLGVWSELVMAMWGSIDLTVDPYSLSKSGGLRIVALQDMDFGIRHPDAFAYNSGDMGE